MAPSEFLQNLSINSVYKTNQQKHQVVSSAFNLNTISTNCPPAGPYKKGVNNCEKWVNVRLEIRKFLVFADQKTCHSIKYYRQKDNTNNFR